MNTTSRRTRRNTALAAATGVALGALVATVGPDLIGPDNGTGQPTNQVAAPAPGATIPGDERTGQEDRYLDGVRHWTSPAMDTNRWTDHDLVDYATATCAVLDTNPDTAQYVAHMDAQVPATGSGTPTEDLSYTEAIAVETWCPEHAHTLADIRH